MAIIRVEKQKNYTVMSNHHLQDGNLSLKAKGLLSMMLSLPEDWVYSVEGLVSLCKEGRDAVRSALTELEDTGYMVRGRTRDEHGKLREAEYVIYEAPQTASETGPDTPEPTPEEPASENRTLENPTLQNTKRTNYLKTNPPIIPPQGDGSVSRKKREPKAAPDWKPERFARFWESYPRGEDKQAAIREWDKLQPDDVLLREMSLGLARDMQSPDWQRGIGIPYACRWLKHRRWEDEHRTPPQEPEPQPEQTLPKGAYRL